MATVIDPILPREDQRHTARQPLLPLLFAAAGGIVLDRYWPLNFGQWWLIASAAWLAWRLLMVRRLQTPALVGLLLSVTAGFAAWHHERWNAFAPDELGRFAGPAMEPMCLKATALSGVAWRPAPKRDPLRTVPQGDQCRVLIRAHAVRDGRAWRPISGEATLAIDGHLLGVQAGDRLQVFVFAYRVPPPPNPVERDMAAHERVSRRLVRLEAPAPDCVRVLERGAWWNGRRLLARLREACHAQLWRHIAPQRAGLAAGLLVGSREQIDFEQTEQFFLTGTIHILAISGVHVGILAWGFAFVMRFGFLGRVASLWAAIGFVALYTLLAEMEPPVLRSAILVTVMCLGRLWGHPLAAWNSLAAGGLIVLGLNPTQLFQVGAQLSFLAVATLIWCGPLLVVKRPDNPFDRWLADHASPYVRWRRGAFSYVWRLWLTGTVVWLVALPLTTYRFHLVTPSALWVNPLVWLPITLALYSGFAALSVGWLLPPLGAVFGWTCDRSLAVVAWLIARGEASPGSHAWHPGPALWWVLGFYAGLGFYLALPRFRPRWYWMAAMLAVWSAAGAVTSVRSPLNIWSTRAQELRATFVAVGHGTSVLVELPGGETILYDAGHMGTPRGGAESISAVLWSRGITHLSAVVLSHADADHYNALPDLLERFSVGEVYVSPLMFLLEPEGVATLHAAIRRHGVPVRTIHGGDTLHLTQGVRCDVLHPPARGVGGSDNANSIVLAFEYRGRRLLLPGDLEAGGLADVLAEEPLPSDVVMAPHHGSARSNPRGFAQWSQPQWVVISGSRSRDASEVVDAYRSFGAEVLHTGHDNALAFVFTAGSLRVFTWHGGAWQERRHREASDPP